MKKLVKLPNGDEWSGKVKDGRAVKVRIIITNVAIVI